MRHIRSVPLLALIILAYVLLVQSGSMLQPDSTFYDTVLPSGAEIFFLVGDAFVVAVLVALLLEILKIAGSGSTTIVDHLLSLATLTAAVICFVLVPACGTVSFFMLTIMALIDVLGGLFVSLLAARRDASESRETGR